MKYKIAPNGEITSNEVKVAIMTNDKAVMKAAMILYNEQNPEEQTGYKSLVENKRGFNKLDAPELTYFARTCISKKGNKTSEIKKVRYMLVKYSTQIAKITNEKKDLQLEWRFN